MARAKQQRREKGSGSITKRGSGYYLTLTVTGRAVQRAILEDDGKGCVGIERARELAPALADAIRAEVQRNLHGWPLAELEEVYLRYLPTYSKRHGALHVDASAQTRLAPQTLRGNVSRIRDFVARMAERHPEVRTVEGVTMAHAREFLAGLYDMKPASYNRALYALRHVFRVVPCGANPFATETPRSADEVKSSTTGHRAFSIEELATMQTKATGWIRAAMFVSYHSGLRLGDVVTLKWSEIDDAGNITKTQRKTGKREIVYAPEALPALNVWRTEQGDTAGEYIFPVQAAAYLGLDRKRDQSLPVIQFMRFLRQDCGIEGGKRSIGFHSLRSSHATYSRKSGQSLTDVQKRLAHSSAATTAGYVYLSDDDVKRELRATHRALLLPGATTPADQADAVDRERLEALVRTMPISEVRAMLAKAERGAK